MSTHAFSGLRIRAVSLIALSFVMALAHAQDRSWPEWPTWAPGFTGQITFMGGVEGLDVDAGPVTAAEDYATADRCLAHGFAVPGQGLHVSGSGLHVSGSTGGLVIGDVVILDENSDPVQTATSRHPWQFMQDVSGIPPAATFKALLGNGLESVSRAAGRTVVILVADDFAGGKVTIPGEVFTYGPSDLPKLDSLVASGSLSHGALVLHHLNSLISGSGLFGFVPVSAPVPGRYEWVPTADHGDRLIIQAVDLRSANTPLITTGAIVSGLYAGVESLRGELSGEQDVHFVVNMSWVLLPCATVEAFDGARADFLTFEKYLAALEVEGFDPGAAGDPTYTANVLRLLSWVGPEDSLFKLIAGDPSFSTSVPFTLFESAKVAFVAAAGNFGMDYQMLPAAWPMVVGVGAPRGDQLPGLQQEPPPFTNSSEVAAPGAWFLLQRSPEFDAPTSIEEPDSVVSYAGTSFSAPMISLFTAVDLLAGPDARCSPDDVRAQPPGLADDPPVNRWLGNAAEDCSYP